MTQRKLKRRPTLIWTFFIIFISKSPSDRDNIYGCLRSSRISCSEPWRSKVFRYMITMSSVKPSFRSSSLLCFFSPEVNYFVWIRFILIASSKPTLTILSLSSYSSSNRTLILRFMISSAASSASYSFPSPKSEHTIPTNCLYKSVEYLVLYFFLLSFHLLNLWKKKKTLISSILKNYSHILLRSNLCKISPLNQSRLHRDEQGVLRIDWKN